MMVQMINGVPQEELPPKPRTERLQPELTRVPRLTLWRRAFRQLMRRVAWVVVRLCTRTRLHGVEHFPMQGAALIVSNHLGDADTILSLAYFPRPSESLAKIDLYFDYPPLGWLMDAYGVIWLHRGRADRRALRCAIQGLGEGRLVAIAPEGRESLSGALEEGTGGVAYLALKSGVPLVPVTFTGTENSVVFSNLRHLRRSEVTITIGPAFNLPEFEDFRQAIREGTQTIMFKLAEQLPEHYRGVYRYIIETEVPDDR
jgi:1-acyl-sn-glycerol-3-phosphate acyltransferase